MIILQIPNTNNKLLNDIFIHIGAAPASEPSVADMNRPMFVDLPDGTRKQVALFSIEPIPFFKVNSFHTYLSAAQPAWLWRDEYKKKFPGVKDESMMAIYFYKKVY